MIKISFNDIPKINQQHYRLSISNLNANIDTSYFPTKNLCIFSLAHLPLSQFFRHKINLQARALQPICCQLRDQNRREHPRCYNRSCRYFFFEQMTIRWIARRAIEPPSFSITVFLNWIFTERAFIYPIVIHLHVWQRIFRLFYYNNLYVYNLPKHLEYMPTGLFHVLHTYHTLNYCSFALCSIFWNKNFSFSSLSWISFKYRYLSGVNKHFILT